MPLATLDLLKQMPELGRYSDALLQQLLDAADQAVRDYCKRDFTSQAYTQFYSGNGERDLLLRQRPVSAVASVYADDTGYYGDGPDAFAADTLLTAGADYVLVRDDGAVSASGRLRRLGGGTGAGNGAACLEDYGAGYTAGAGLLAARRAAYWPRGDGNIKVVYTAGYATVPAAVQQAVVALAAWVARTPGATGHPLQQEQLGRYAYTIATQAIGQAPDLGSVRQLLAKYREAVV